MNDELPCRERERKRLHTFDICTHNEYRADRSAGARARGAGSCGVPSVGNAATNQRQRGARAGTPRPSRARRAARVSLARSGLSLGARSVGGVRRVASSRASS